jgi:hypothetical protein
VQRIAALNREARVVLLVLASLSVLSAAGSRTALAGLAVVAGAALHGRIAGRARAP